MTNLMRETLEELRKTTGIQLGLHFTVKFTRAWVPESEGRGWCLRAWA